MNDQLGLFDRRGDDETGELDLNDLRAALRETAAAPAPPRRPVQRREQRAVRIAAAKRRKRRRRHTLIALVTLAVLAAGVVVGLSVWRKDVTAVADFPGSGDSETVVRVGSGDSLTDIADTLAADKVVASAESFVTAATDVAAMRSVKTGFYKVRQHASAAAAVGAITDPAAAVGKLRLIPGRQLADVSTKSAASGDKQGGAVTPGYISAITQAACVPLNGIRKCFTADDLWKVAETADPVSALGVPSWAAPGASGAPDARRRLEGTLVPGDYNVPPTADPLEALQSVISASAATWNTTGVVAEAKTLGVTPYQLAVVASLVEREGNRADMPKVARVTFNRLAAHMRLQFDSTVNYSLDRAQISTTAAERAHASPYNTYAVAGLPPTPISSPGPDAIDAALHPDDGNWLYFVKIDLKGNSCFSETLEQHNKCVAQARANGVFGR